MAFAAMAACAGRPPDLTGAGPDAFRARLGQVVSLRGRLESGKEGYSLWGETPPAVPVYIIPDMPPNGTYHYPPAWEKFLHQQVRVTGELHYRSFPRADRGGID